MKLRSALLPTLIALLASLLAVLGPLPPAVADPAPAQVTGTVIDAVTSDLLAGAHVAFYADVDENGMPDGAAIASTVATDGSFDVFVPAGSVVGIAEAEGYEPRQTEVLHLVSAEETILQLDLTPIDDGTGTGTVSGFAADALANTPLAGAAVSIYADADVDGQPDGAAVATTSAAVNGTWELTVPAGKYVIQVAHPTYETWSSYPGRAPVTVTSGGSITNVEAYLQRVPPTTGHVSGHVTDQDTAAGIAGATVVVYKDDDGNGFPDEANPVALTTTDAEALWASTLPVGSYVASASAEDYDSGVHGTFTVTAGGELTVDFALEPTTPPGELGSTIAGLLTDTAGTPLGGIEVCAWTASDTIQACVDTDADGRYALAGLPAGSYRICYNDRLPAPGEWATYEMLRWYLDKGSRPFATPVVVDGTVTTTTLSTVRLRKLARIKGVVGAPALVGATSAAGTVEVYDEDGERVAVAPISSNGAYEVGGLLPGAYRVKASGSRFIGNDEYPYIRQFWSRRYSFASATPIALGVGEVRTGIDILLGRTLLATARPVITGRRIVGSTLRAGRGTWNRQVGTTYTFTWRRGTRVLSHAATYRVVRADAGRALTVTVTAKDPDGWLLSGSSAATTGVIRQ